MSKTIKREIISEIADRQSFMNLLANNPGLIILKFGATWCQPCKKIKPVIDAFFATVPDNVLCGDIDVDTSFDVYGFLKSKKMVNGIPVILCYKKGNTTYIPDDSITGIDPKEMDAFFKRCAKHLDWVRVNLP